MVLFLRFQTSLQSRFLGPVFLLLLGSEFILFVPGFGPCKSLGLKHITVIIMCAGISVPVLLCCNQLKKNLVTGWGKVLPTHIVYQKPVPVTSLSLCLSWSPWMCTTVCVHTHMYALLGGGGDTMNCPILSIQYTSVLFNIMHMHVYISREKVSAHTAKRQFSPLGVYQPCCHFRQQQKVPEIQFIPMCWSLLV